MPDILLIGSANNTIHDNNDIKEVISNSEQDSLISFLNNRVIENLQLTIGLCTTKFISIKKTDMLKQIIEYILESSFCMCPQNVHLALTYIVIQSLFNKGLAEEAITLSIKSIEHFNDDEMKIAAFDTTANLYFLLGEHSKSIEYLNEAIKLNSKYPNIWKNQALNYEQLLDFKKAEECIDMALKVVPDNPSLTNLKEKYNRLKKNTINFNDIRDEDVKKFFMSAERLVLDLSKSIDENDFDFTMALVSYGKGLESLLHKEVSKPLKEKIYKKYGSPISDEYLDNLPYSLKSILGEKERTISLGSWNYIINDCKKNPSNPIVKDSRDYFTGKLNKDKQIIFDSCKTVSDYRNGSAHYTSKSLDEILEDRKIIVEQINKVINLLCSRGIIGA